MPGNTQSNSAYFEYYVKSIILTLCRTRLSEALMLPNMTCVCFFCIIQQGYLRRGLPRSFKWLCETVWWSVAWICIPCLFGSWWSIPAFFYLFIFVNRHKPSFFYFTSFALWLVPCVKWAAAGEILTLKSFSTFCGSMIFKYGRATPNRLMFPRARLWVNISACIELPCSITLLWLQCYMIACTHREILADSVRRLADCSSAFICAFPNGVVHAQTFMLKER